jgi:putative copper export protein
MELYRLLLILHLLGAATWVGGHLVLSLTVLPRALRAGDPAILRDFEAGYERVGIPALLLQAATGVWLAHRWLPQPALWFTIDAPLSALVFWKFVLLGLTLALAAHARLRVIPRLGRDNLRLLAAHIVLVTVLGVGFVILGVGIRTGGLF